MSPPVINKIFCLQDEPNWYQECQQKKNYYYTGGTLLWFLAIVEHYILESIRYLPVALLQ